MGINWPWEKRNEPDHKGVIKQREYRDDFSDKEGQYTLVISVDGKTDEVLTVSIHDENQKTKTLYASPVFSKNNTSFEGKTVQLHVHDVSGSLAVVEFCVKVLNDLHRMSPVAPGEVDVKPLNEMVGIVLKEGRKRKGEYDN